MVGYAKVKRAMKETARVTTGLSVDRKILAAVDEARGDISRSRFIERILDLHLAALTKTEVERDG